MRRKKTDPMMEGDVRRESAIPVQGRISIVELAKMCMYWEDVEFVRIDSMGKLLSWSVSALCNLLESNDKMPEGIDSVASAHKYLTNKGIYQKSLSGRSLGKIGTAIKFESLREQGIDPREVIPVQHNMVNNKHSVETYDGPGMRAGVNKDDVEMARKMIALEKQKNAAKEKRIQDEENAPLDSVEEMMKLQEERKKQVG